MKVAHIWLLSVTVVYRPRRSQGCLLLPEYIIIVVVYSSLKKTTTAESTTEVCAHDTALWLTSVHLPVQYGQSLQGVVIGGLQRCHFLCQSKSLVLLPSSLQTDGLQDLEETDSEYTLYFNWMQIQPFLYHKDIGHMETSSNALVWHSSRKWSV